MLDVNFFNKLQEKYNYNEKTMNALRKILPCLISYYGNEHVDLILDAVLNCEIVPCNSYQTISKVKKEKEFTKFTGESVIGDVDLKRGEGVYISSPRISYNEMTNTFNIDDVSRVIITPHTFNYDSPKGLEVLTYALCKLVKSYKNEYKIDENILIKRYGISVEERNIIKDEEIYLDFKSDEGKGLEEGFTIYDAEQIVSLILFDNYEFHDYKGVYNVAFILKNRFNLQDDISFCELYGDFEGFLKVCYNKDKLFEKCDECLVLEHEMFISMSREDKDNFKNRIRNIMNNDLFNILNDILIKQNKNSVKG